MVMCGGQKQRLNNEVVPVEGGGAERKHTRVQCVGVGKSRTRTEDWHCCRPEFVGLDCCWEWKKEEAKGLEIPMREKKTGALLRGSELKWGSMRV